MFLSSFILNFLILSELFVVNYSDDRIIFSDEDLESVSSDIEERIMVAVPLRPCPPGYRRFAVQQNRRNYSYNNGSINVRHNQHQPQTGFIPTRLQPNQQHRSHNNQSHHQHHRSHHNQNQHRNQSNQHRGMMNQPYMLYQTTTTSKPIPQNIRTTSKLPSTLLDKLEKDLNKTGTLFIIDVPCPAGTKYVKRTGECRRIF
ncbi:hypothetical protein O3M35_005184 [Rhynocoris fuscipes]|uniref:Uncharacterized protein n=1 Tax=Rhynocoris fuscipes TaxID=488301 RepID=A0AAW1DJN0_9HEMI